MEYDRDTADYVYETEKLINLSGKSIMEENHINGFLYGTGAMRVLQMKMWKNALKWQRSGKTQQLRTNEK